MTPDRLDLVSVATALPGYELTEEIGRGGYGVVLGGRQIQLGREVAIKQLSTELSSSADVRARFITVARVLASFTHPHIVPIYDYVERDGLCLLVMERLPAGTVWQQFRRHGMTIETACVVVMATCSGLHYSHGRGVLHRDVKPENLLVSSEKALKVTDFGIAEVLGGKETLATRYGEVVGTPAYMAPEQAGGREVDARADIYTTGVVLYELLSGRLPFSQDGDAVDVAARHIGQAAAPLAEVAPHVPGPLAEVTMRAIAERPDDRFPTAEAFGVAVARAATASCGPEWMARAELSLLAPGPIMAAAEQSASTQVEPSGATGAYTVADLVNVGLHPQLRVRPEAPDHAERAPAPPAADLLPISQVIRPQADARLPHWAGIVLWVLVALPLLSAVAGVLALTWVFGGREPAMATVVACAVLGAGAGLAFAIAAVRRSRRRQPNPASDQRRAAAVVVGVAVLAALIAGAIVLRPDSPSGEEDRLRTRGTAPSSAPTSSDLSSPPSSTATTASSDGGPDESASTTAPPTSSAGTTSRQRPKTSTTKPATTTTTTTTTTPTTTSPE